MIVDRLLQFPIHLRFDVCGDLVETNIVPIQISNVALSLNIISVFVHAKDGPIVAVGSVEDICVILY